MKIKITKAEKEGIALDKYCPLKFNVNTLDRDGEMLTQANKCEGKDCAWWIERTKECAVKLIAVESSNLIALKLGNRIV